jgi:hypothetical protein
MDVAGQLSEQTDQYSMLDLDTIQKENVGDVLGQLMTVNMSTQAHIDTGNLQQVLGFLVSSVRTLATESQHARTVEQQLRDANVALAQQIADSAATVPAPAPPPESPPGESEEDAAGRLAAEAEAARVAAEAEALAKKADAAAAAAAESGTLNEHNIGTLQETAAAQAAELKAAKAAQAALLEDFAKMQAELRAAQDGMGNLETEAKLMAAALTDTQQRVSVPQPARPRARRAQFSSVPSPHTPTHTPTHTYLTRTHPLNPESRAAQGADGGARAGVGDQACGGRAQARHGAPGGPEQNPATRAAAAAAAAAAAT